MCAYSACVFWFVGLTWVVSVEQEDGRFMFPSPWFGSVHQSFPNVCFVLILNCCLSDFFSFGLCVHADREADGAGAAGIAQHAQKAGVLSAGSTWSWHGQKICKTNQLLIKPLLFYLSWIFSWTQLYHQITLKTLLFSPWETLLVLLRLMDGRCRNYNADTPFRFTGAENTQPLILCNTQIWNMASCQLNSSCDSVPLTKLKKKTVQKSIILFLCHTFFNCYQWTSQNKILSDLFCTKRTHFPLKALNSVIMSCCRKSCR